MYTFYPIDGGCLLVIPRTLHITLQRPFYFLWEYIICHRYACNEANVSKVICSNHLSAKEGFENRLSWDAVVFEGSRGPRPCRLPALCLIYVYQMFQQQARNNLELTFTETLSCWWWLTTTLLYAPPLPHIILSYQSSCHQYFISTLPPNGY